MMDAQIKADMCVMQCVWSRLLFCQEADQSSSGSQSDRMGPCLCIPHAESYSLGESMCEREYHSNPLNGILQSIEPTNR